MTFCWCLVRLLGVWLAWLGDSEGPVMKTFSEIVGARLSTPEKLSECILLGQRQVSVRDRVLTSDSELVKSSDFWTVNDDEASLLLPWR